MDKMMRVRSIPLGTRGEETAALLEYIGADDYRHAETWYQERRVFSMTTYIGEEEGNGWNEIRLSALACLSSDESREAVVSGLLTFRVVESTGLKDGWFDALLSDVREKTRTGEPLIPFWNKENYWVSFE